jgi:hypothetical protein
VLLTSFRVGVVLVGGTVPVMTAFPMRPYFVWSSLKVCFLKGVQLEEVKSKIIAGALLAEAVANMAISKCWEKKEIKRTTMYLLISLGSLECDKLSSMVW